MRFRTRFPAALLMLAGIGFLLPACGNRGPLTLPPKDSAVKPATAIATRPPPDNINTVPSGKQ